MTHSFPPSKRYTSPENPSPCSIQKPFCSPYPACYLLFSGVSLRGGFCISAAAAAAAVVAGMIVLLNKIDSKMEKVLELALVEQQESAK